MNQLRSLCLIVACACLLVGAVVSTAAARQIDTSHPPVFSELSLDDAKKKALDENRILVVKGTAAWCGPCRTMDKTTWRDAKVEAWFKEKGIAIQLDVDKKPKEAQALRVRAMPTMIAFKGGEEVGRVVGMQSADQMLVWLGGVEKGENQAAGLLDRLRKARADPKSMSMQERMEMARELADAGEVDQAADEFVWLWDNIQKYQPSMAGVRVSFMIGSMEQLAAEHEGAKKKFVSLRDSAWAKFDDAKAPQRARDLALSDWAALNEAVGEEDKTLAWYDSVMIDPQWDGAVRGISHRLKRLLEGGERWSDLGRMLDSPEEELEDAYRIIEMSKVRRLPAQDDDMQATIKQLNERRFREDIGRAHASYLAAKRDKDAAALADGAIKKDDSAALRVALVRWAIKAKQPRESQRAWLDQAAAAGEDWPGVRTALEEALKAADAVAKP